MIAIESRKNLGVTKFNFWFDNAAFGGRQARWAEAARLEGEKVRSP
jgi:hypothetical protein